MKAHVPVPARMPVYQGENINFLRMRPRVATVYGSQTPPADAEFVDFVSVLRPRQMLDAINHFQDPDYTWDSSSRAGSNNALVDSNYQLWMIPFRRRSGEPTNPLRWQFHFQRGSNTSTQRLTIIFNPTTESLLPVYSRPIIIDTREWVVDEVEVFRQGQFLHNATIGGCYCYWFASTTGDVYVNPGGTPGMSVPSFDNITVSGLMGWGYGVHINQSPSYTTASVRHLIGNYEVGGNYFQTPLHQAFFPYIPSYVSYGASGVFDTGGFGASFPFVYPAAPVVTGDAPTRIVFTPFFAIRDPANTNSILEPEPMVVIKVKCRRNRLS